MIRSRYIGRYRATLERQADMIKYRGSRRPKSVFFFFGYFGVNFSNKDTEVCSQRRTRFSIELLIVQWNDTNDDVKANNIRSTLGRPDKTMELTGISQTLFCGSCFFLSNSNESIPKKEKNTKILWLFGTDRPTISSKNDVIGWLIKTKSQLKFKMIWKIKQNLVIWLDNMSSHWLAISPDVKQTKNGPPWEFIFFP